MRKQKVFRIKSYFKNLISHKSIDDNINNSDLVNDIIENFNFKNLNIDKMVNEPKLSKENVQVVYRLDESNIEKIESLAQRYDIKYSIVLNHIFEFYFNGDS
ncbi:hypothetical protein I4131_12485 [Staphylococcus aureus]|nr:hypothetical protein [Staphylococcus aureus]